MKKILLLACTLFVATMFTSCFSKQSETVIYNSDGSQEVDLVGTWKSEQGSYTFKMIFGIAGSFTYGCGDGVYGGPAQLSVGGDGEIRVDKEFNRWWYKGTYKTSGNVLIVTVEQVKDYTRGSSNLPGAGETQNFIINIVSEDELVIQTSGTGSTRTYKRQ